MSGASARTESEEEDSSNDQDENHLGGNSDESVDITKMRKTELFIPRSVFGKWENVSPAAINFTLMAMESSIKRSVCFLIKDRSEGERAIREGMKRVEEALSETVAPVGHRHADYTKLSQTLDEKTKEHDELLQ